MIQTYWQKQGDQPLFNELLWDKPENKLHAGKLLIIGGNLHSFIAPATAYKVALNAGVGVCKVLLPDSLKKIVGSHIEDAEFAPSNKSGSFSSQSLADWLDNSAWSDGILLPGDLGRNSETAIILEKFIDKYFGQITIAGDTLDYFISSPKQIIIRPNTTLITSFRQLQKLGMTTQAKNAYTHDMPITKLVENLYEFTRLHSVNIILKHYGNYFVASSGSISTTKTTLDNSDWHINIATRSAVWSLQNPTKIFEALTTSVLNA